MLKITKKMREKSEEIIDPINQLRLYGYKKYFDLLKNLFAKKKLPNCILLSGQEGIGKSTFAYHLTNYIFSKEENDKYDFENNIINKNNYSFNLVKKNSHPNFFLVSNDRLLLLLKFKLTPAFT